VPGGFVDNLEILGMR